ncbi:MAG: D-alanyl-D-alanine carboxypeptidase [Patescibacteria group bacterium]|nr:D-alanyl-D-alanine carboxypeptidase [Patescibacteria group bacterium]
MKSTKNVGLIVVAVFLLAAAAFYKLGIHHFSTPKEPSSAQAVVPAEVTSTIDTPLNITAEAYGVYNINGAEIIGNNVNKVWPLASVTKLMTAEIATSFMASDTPVAITSSTMSEIGGNDPRVRIGEVYSLSQMLKLMLVMSDNAAAQAIADTYGTPQFIAAMNAKAKSLGMNETNYADSVGLSNQSAGTIADMAKLVSYLWSSNKSILDTTTITTGYVQPENSNVKHFIINIDQLSGHPDFLGGKTGTTPDAKDNIVAVLKRDNINNGEPFIIAVFGSTSRYSDVDKIISAIPK